MMSPKTVRLSVELPEDTQYVRVIRRLSACLLEDLHVAREVVEDVETVVGEICTNVVRHARSERGLYRLTLEVSTDRLVVIVQDRGPGFDPAYVPLPGTLRPDADGGLRIGGMGLPLLASLTDRLAFLPADPHGTTVRAEVSLRPA
jgi:anti-sigma regulatory factor (Ser/Thr protein kinase)